MKCSSAHRQRVFRSPRSRYNQNYIFPKLAFVDGGLLIWLHMGIFVGNSYIPCQTFRRSSLNTDQYITNCCTCYLAGHLLEKNVYYRINSVPHRCCYLVLQSPPKIPAQNQFHRVCVRELRLKNYADAEALQDKFFLYQACCLTNSKRLYRP